MFDDRNLKLDLFALGLLALVVFLTLAMVTYHKSDPPSTLVYPPAAEVQNLCGRTGAVVAHTMLETLGIGAFYLVVSLAVLDYLLLTRSEIDQPFGRAIGWALSILGLTTLASLVMPGGFPGPVIGPGGYVGAAGLGLLELQFAAAGSFILALSALLAGMLLCTDYVLLRLSARAVGLSVQGVWAVGQNIAQRRQGAEGDEEEWEEEEEEDEDYEPAVRIRGKVTDEEAEEDEEVEEEDEEEEEDEAEDEEEADVLDEEEAEEESEKKSASKSSVKKRLAGALRIRKPKPKKTDEREEVMAELDAASNQEEPLDYRLPSLDLLLESDDVSFEAHEKEVRKKAKMLEKTFASFGFKVRVVEIETGPVIAQYEVELEAGLRLSKITGLADDLAIALRVPSVRIVAPIPGKNTVGIEVPNEHRQLVRLREVMEEVNGRMKRMKIPIYLGKDVSGRPMAVDLATMPHLLIAGRTGTGKSVCLNTIITSILMTRRPDEVRMLMIDPKMVELSPYKTLPHLMHPVVTDMRKAEAILAWAVEKMEERYALLAQAGVRHVSVFNQLGEEELRDRLQPETDEAWEATPKNLPFIVIVADEIADLMMTSGKDVEQHIIRLAQKSRAVGIHLILATQKPTVDVITGLIKSNLPARIAFQVSSRTDSRVVLDEMGADKLLGNGDMLFLQPGTSMLMRGQGTFLSDDEINRVIDCVGTTEQNFVKELVQLKAKDEEGNEPGKLKNRDELYESAVDMVVRERRGSVSLLQRTLGIGYGRAARLIDFMAEDGIVGEYNGSQAREVLLTVEDWEVMNGEEPAEPAVETKKPRRSNKIVPVAEEDEAEEEVEEDEAEVPWDEAEEDEAEEDEAEEDEYEEVEDGEEEDDEYEYEYEYEEEEVEASDDDEEDEEYEEEDEADDEYEYEEEEDEQDESYHAESA